MKTAFLLLFSFIALQVSAQTSHVTTPTDTLTVTGKIKAGYTISLADIARLKAAPIPGLIITNHTGEPRRSISSMKGVLLKTVLEKVIFDCPSPKLLSKFYFVCTASDGYTVVYSWNELYNTATGDNTFIVTEQDGKSILTSAERIQLITPTDFKTGRRFVKNLRRIDVREVE